MHYVTEVLTTTKQSYEGITRSKRDQQLPVSVTLDSGLVSELLSELCDTQKIK